MRTFRAISYNCRKIRRHSVSQTLTGKGQRMIPGGFLHSTVNARLTPMLNVFKHAEPKIFATLFLISLVNAQMSSSDIIVCIGQDFVAKSGRDD